MIGLFGAQSACRSSSTFANTAAAPATAFKSKSKATNMLLDNQINEKLKEVNSNLIKKRPHFLKFFNESFFKPGSVAIEGINGSPENSCKRYSDGVCLHKITKFKFPRFISDKSRAQERAQERHFCE